MNEKVKQSLAELLKEIVDVLCYQSDIPLAHKQDLVSAWEKYSRARDLDNSITVTIPPISHE